MTPQKKQASKMESKEFPAEGAEDTSYTQTALGTPSDLSARKINKYPAAATVTPYNPKPTTDVKVIATSNSASPVREGTLKTAPPSAAAAAAPNRAPPFKEVNDEDEKMADLHPHVDQPNEALAVADCKEDSAGFQMGAVDNDAAADSLVPSEHDANDDPAQEDMDDQGNGEEETEDQARAGAMLADVDDGAGGGDVDRHDDDDIPMEIEIGNGRDAERFPSPIPFDLADQQQPQNAGNAVLHDLNLLMILPPPFQPQPLIPQNLDPIVPGRVDDFDISDLETVTLDFM